MSQIATFYNPFPLPNAAGAIAAENGTAAPIESFEAALQNLNALLAITDPNAPAPIDATSNAGLLAPVAAPFDFPPATAQAIPNIDIEAPLAAQLALLQGITAEATLQSTPSAQQPPTGIDADRVASSAAANIVPGLRGTFAAQTETASPVQQPQIAPTALAVGAAVVAAAKAPAATREPQPTPNAAAPNTNVTTSGHAKRATPATPATPAEPGTPAEPATPATPAKQTETDGPVQQQQTAPSAPAVGAAMVAAAKAPETSRDPQPTPNAAKPNTNAISPGLVKRATPATLAIPAMPATSATPATPEAPATPAEPPAQTQANARQTKPVDAAAPLAIAPLANQPTEGGQQSTNGPAQQTAPAVAGTVVQVLPTLVAAQAMGTTLAPTPQTAVPLDALAVHIARKFEQGASEYEIRLHPADLGKLDITLSVADDGRVQAIVRAERPETLELLQRDARSLEQQLRQAGLDVGSNALSFSLSNGHNHRQAPFAGWPAFAGASDAANTPPDQLVSNYIAVRVRDGVDIRV